MMCNAFTLKKYPSPDWISSLTGLLIQIRKWFCTFYYITSIGNQVGQISSNEFSLNEAPTYMFTYTVAALRCFSSHKSLLLLQACDTKIVRIENYEPLSLVFTDDK